MVRCVNLTQFLKASEDPEQEKQPINGFRFGVIGNDIGRSASWAAQVAPGAGHQLLSGQDLATRLAAVAGFRSAHRIPLGSTKPTVGCCNHCTMRSL